MGAWTKLGLIVGGYIVGGLAVYSTLLGVGCTAQQNALKKAKAELREARKETFELRRRLSGSDYEA